MPSLLLCLAKSPFTIKGKRERGRPRNMWLDNIKDSGHGCLLTTSWTQLRIELIGERWWLRHSFVHSNDCLGQRIYDGDDDDDYILQ